MQQSINVRTTKYTCTEIDDMWNSIGEFLRLSNIDNVYIYGRYSFLCNIALTEEQYIMKRDDCILFENFMNYFDRVISVHFYQILDPQGRIIINPLRIRENGLDNTNPFRPRNALYMSITVRNYNGPEVPDDFENEEYTKEYYFMRNGYGIYVSSRGFGTPQNMQLIPMVQTKNMSNEEINDIIRSSFDEDFSEDDNESDGNEISINRSTDNSHVPLM